MKCMTYVVIKSSGQMITLEGDPYPGPLPGYIELEGERFVVISRTEAQNYEFDLMAVTMIVDRTPVQ